MRQSWNAFLKQLKNEKQVTLVGPLHGQPVVAEGPTIYVDGGVEFCESPSSLSISVGDQDSTERPLDEVLPTDKDFSDLAYVLRHLPGSLEEIRLFGFLGGRLDHELANLGEIAWFLRERKLFCRVNAFADNKLKVVAFSPPGLTLQINGGFSLFVLEPTLIKVTGQARYLTTEPTLFHPLSSHGLSNEGHGNIAFETNAPCLVHLI